MLAVALGEGEIPVRIIVIVVLISRSPDDLDIVFGVFIYSIQIPYSEASKSVTNLH